MSDQATTTTTTTADARTQPHDPQAMTDAADAVTIADAMRSQAATPDELAAAGMSVSGMGAQAQIDADAAGLGVATIEITSPERVVGIDYEQAYEVGQVYEVPAELAAFLVGSGSAWVRLPALLGPGAYAAEVDRPSGRGVWVRLVE